MSDIPPFLGAMDLLGEVEISPCGSRVTCSRPPADTDIDYLVVFRGDIPGSVLGNLSDAGWEWEGDSAHYQQVAEDGFMSWRKGAVNLIITKSEKFAKLHKVATHVCRTLNLSDKHHRIMVFQAVLYGTIAESKGE